MNYILPEEHMNYQQALDYLYSFMSHQCIPAQHIQAARAKLFRVQSLLAEVGNPQTNVHCIVVAGTNGKGSTCAMIESVLRHAGYRTGLWTSPHLHSYRERIQINRQMINRQDLISAVEHIRLVMENFDVETWGKPVTFELGFVLALRYFADQGVQFAILEVGLGGRYDAVNVVHPLVSAIASISYDHMHILGHTLEEIAYDKAGIMKPGIATVTIPQYECVAATLSNAAREVAASLWVAQEDMVQQLLSDGLPPVQDIGLSYPWNMLPALQGTFQFENARLAAGVLLLLREQGIAISDGALACGLSTVQWPGRFEIVERNPSIVLDGAHNSDAIEKLVRALRTEFDFDRLLLILGLSQDKHGEAIVACIVPQARVVILSHSCHPRAQTNLEYLASLASPYLHGILIVSPHIGDAIEQARLLAQPNDVICITGSLFIVAEARAVFGLASERD